MSHRSRLGVICIDCQTDDLAEAARFWGEALGAEVTVDPNGRYAHVEDRASGPRVLLQAVDHAPRVHLDLETDDKEAEVARLRGAGAHEIARIKSWIVMEAPTGHRFCVVGPQGTDFPGDAREFE